MIFRTFRWMSDMKYIYGIFSACQKPSNCRNILTASNSSCRCMCVLMNRMLWIVFSITKGIFLLSCRSSGPEINFWKPSKIESKCILSCPLSLSLLPWNKIVPIRPPLLYSSNSSLPTLYPFFSFSHPFESTAWGSSVSSEWEVQMLDLRIKVSTVPPDLQTLGPPAGDIYFASLQTRPSQPAWGLSSSGSLASFVSEYSAPRWASCECWASCSHIHCWVLRRLLISRPVVKVEHYSGQTHTHCYQYHGE